MTVYSLHLDREYLGHVWRQFRLNYRENHVEFLLRPLYTLIIVRIISDLALTRIAVAETKEIFLNRLVSLLIILYL